MRIVIAYESMFGTTHHLADLMAGALAGEHEVSVVAAGDAPDDLGAVDLLMVGAPTHVHSLPRPRTRLGVPGMVEKSGGVLHSDPSAASPGVRELLARLGAGHAAAAAFDTRMRGPALFTGRPSRAIARRLRGHGFHVVGSESFLVDNQTHLVAGEEERAASWARKMAGSAARAAA
jgi:hypothetical protein